MHYVITSVATGENIPLKTNMGAEEIGDQMATQFLKDLLASDEAGEISVSQLCSVVNAVHDLNAAVFTNLANNFGTPVGGARGQYWFLKTSILSK